jgi:hypothetical protein
LLTIVIARHEQNGTGFHRTLHHRNENSMRLNKNIHAQTTIDINKAREDWHSRRALKYKSLIRQQERAKYGPAKGAGIAFLALRLLVKPDVSEHALGVIRNAGGYYAVAHGKLRHHRRTVLMLAVELSFTN